MRRWFGGFAGVIWRSGLGTRCESAAGGKVNLGPQWRYDMHCTIKTLIQVDGAFLGIFSWLS